MAPIIASPKFKRSAALPQTSSDHRSLRVTTRRSGKSPKSPFSTPQSTYGKKKVGTRGKCCGCMKMDEIIKAHQLFRRTIMNKADKVEEISAQCVRGFFQIQEYVDMVAPMVKNTGKITQQLANDATKTPTQSDIIDIDRSP